MQELHKLLFELSSAERIRIMQELEKKAFKLSHLSRELDLTVTETSRHLQRLNDAEIIFRNPQGKYELTRFGRLTLFLLGSFNFLSLHRAYFQEYDVSGLPKQLIYRLGELGQGRFSPETFENLEEGFNKIKEAKELVWILSDAILDRSIPILKEKMSASFDVRIILPDGKFPPESESQLPSTRGIQKRVLPKVDVLVVLTDSFAVFCLPNKSGRIDYSGFSGKNAVFHGWCKDLFLCYWDRAKPIGSK